MSYQALYRKWRPATFDEMIGQDAVVTTLKNQIKAGRIGHAYLFCGTRGTGKTTAAKIFAKAVNCPHAAEHGGSPCNACEICTSINTGRAMNVFEIDAASNNGVDNIRDIREQVEYPPVTGRYKVYIIDEAHMLSTGAFNALLKTLEEPPGYVIFILATTDPQKVPATILSRCQRYDFRRMSRADISGHMRTIAVSEGYSIEPKALEYIAEAADGSMRDGLSILDQCCAYHTDGRLGYDDVLEILGAIDVTVYSRLYRHIIAGEVEDAIRLIGDMVAGGGEIGRMTVDFIWYLRDVLLAASGGKAEALGIPEDKFALAVDDAALAGRPRLIGIISALSELSNRMRFASQKRVLLEVEIIRLCTVGSGGVAGTAGNTNTVAVNAAYTAAGNAAYSGVRDAASDVNRSAASGMTHGDTSGMPGRTGQPVSARLNIELSDRKAAKRDNYDYPDTQDDTDLAYKAAAHDRAGVQDVTAAHGAAHDDLNVRNEAAAQESQTENDVDSAGNAPEAAGMPQQALSARQEVSDAGGIPIEQIRSNWNELLGGLAPSNRAPFKGVMIKEEHGGVMLVFSSSVNYKMAATNSEENGLIRLREITAQKLGINVSFMARVARAGELAADYNRATDEELGRINYPVSQE